ncbi:MAG: Trm112 family protein [Pseudomonadota bacterium]
MTDQNGSNEQSEPVRKVDPKVLDLLVCPRTRAPLMYDQDTQELISQQAGLAFPIRGGIPIMLESEARTLP